MPDQTGTDEISPLESFFRDYAEAVGGVCDEVEPQVYDLMLPPPDGSGEPEILRVAFDPEAIPEHPGAQMASPGTPLVDRLLADALARGRRVDLYFTGLNLASRGVEARARKALTLPTGAALKVERTRAMHFPQAVLGFQATFVSDQKEHDLLSAAVDLHHGRQVRHLEALLDRNRLAEIPWEPLPEAPHGGLATAYPVARDRVVRTLAALANNRGRELGDRLDRQLGRMARYYADLRDEIAEQAGRPATKASAADAAAKNAARREGLDREEQMRAAELRQKSSLRVQLRLLTLLVIRQPKLLLRSTIETAGGTVAGRLDLVWDPLVEAIEAVACPKCRHPTFALDIARTGGLFCPSCPTTATPPRPNRHP